MIKKKKKEKKMEITAVILPKVNRCLFIPPKSKFTARFAVLTALPTVCRYCSKLKALFSRRYESSRQFFATVVGKYLRIDICRLISWTFVRTMSKFNGTKVRDNVSIDVTCTNRSI